MKDTASNRSEFRICIQAMFTCLGGEFSDAALLGYWIALNDMELQQVQQACHHAMRTSKFVPKPAELRESVFGKTEDRAMLAWGDVQKSIPIGSYKHVDFEDKIINAAIRNLGGWPAFTARLTDTESEKWARVEFLKCYTNLHSSGVTGEMCDPLPGLSQVEAVAGVLQPPTPKKIGCTNTSRPRIRQSNVKLLEVK